MPIFRDSATATPAPFTTAFSRLLRTDAFAARSRYPRCLRSLPYLHHTRTIFTRCATFAHYWIIATTLPAHFRVALFVRLPVPLQFCCLILYLLPRYLPVVRTAFCRIAPIWITVAFAIATFCLRSLPLPPYRYALPLFVNTITLYVTPSFVFRSFAGGLRLITHRCSLICYTTPYLPVISR